MGLKAVNTKELAGAFLREAVALAAPGIVAVTILLSVAAVARSSPETPAPAETEEPARLCGRTHASRGESQPADLDGITKAYAALKSRLTFSIERSKLDTEKSLDRPFDLGLPACRGSGARRIPLQATVPAAYRNAKLLFVRGDPRGASTLPEELTKSPETEILLVSAAKVRDMAGLSERWGRRVTLAPPKLVQVLGIRCATTLVTFTEKGDEAMLAEGN